MHTRGNEYFIFSGLSFEASRGAAARGVTVKRTDTEEMKYLLKFIFHTVSRTQQGRQKEPSVKTLRPPLSAAIWRHCVLNGRTQRRALPRHQSEEMEI